MNRDVLLQQLAAAESQIELLKVMLVGMRHTLSAPRVDLPDLLPGCEKESDENCARRNGEACETFKTGQRMCRGCGLDPVTGQRSK